MTGDGEDGQAGVNGADNAVASRIVHALAFLPYGSNDEVEVRTVARIVAAERAKAREPFLALADELKGRGWSASDSSIADRIRRAAENGQ